MKVFAIAALSLAGLVSMPLGADAQCSELKQTPQSSGNNGVCNGGNPTQVVSWVRTWSVHAETACVQNGWRREVHPTNPFGAQGDGQCGISAAKTPPECPGAVDAALAEGMYDGQEQKQKFVATVWDNYALSGGGCDPPPSQMVDGEVPSRGCTDSDLCCGGDVSSQCSAEQGDFIQANCECNFGTPIILDVRGDGYELTNFGGGVRFDLKGTGIRRQMSWTSSGGDDAFLGLDRNGNGHIDNGTELFGNHTPQSEIGQRNGFEALRELDTDRNGAIDARDIAYTQLLLWTDRNHNGESESTELSSLANSGVESIALNYREAWRRDRHGNLFRFRASVKGEGGPFAYDVYFLLSESERLMSERPK